MSIKGKVWIIPEPDSKTYRMVVHNEGGQTIGVTNNKIMGMVAAQAGMVGLIGYALGVIGTVAFIKGFSANPFFKGFYIPWQIPLISLVAVVIILAVTGLIAIRSVLKTEPASVFR